MTTTYTIRGYRTIEDDDTNNLISWAPVELSMTFPDSVTTLFYRDEIFDNGLTTEDFSELIPEPILETFDGVPVNRAHGDLAFLREFSIFPLPGDVSLTLRYYYDDSLTEFGDGDVTVEYEFFIGGVEIRDVETQDEYENISMDDIVAPGPDQDFGENVQIPITAFNWDSIVNNNGFPGIVVNGDDSPNEIDGTDGDDTLSGDRGDDTIAAGDGEDDVRGGVGDDEITGGDDNDFLRGGVGEDTMDGGDGVDQMRGQRNADLLSGGDGNDNIKGGGGNDTLNGDDGNDFLKGGTRRDEINGGDGNDRMFGNSFDDILNGDDGDDLLNGGGDNDTLTGGDGNDTLKGGGGSDTFVFDEDMGEDVILDYDLGTDALRISSELLDETVIDGADVEATYGDVRDGVAVLDFGDGNVIVFNGLSTEVGLGGDITVF